MNKIIKQTKSYRDRKVVELKSDKKKQIPLSVPNFEGNEKKYVDDAIEKVWVSTGGAYINQLEKMMAEFLHVEKAVAVQSGTSAIHLALMECSVKPGDLVIVPTLTFIAAVNPVRYQFADPIFIDCDDSMCMDPSKLAEFLRIECECLDGVVIHKHTKKKIKAIVVVHIFGNMAGMEDIMQIAKQYQLPVVEDATEALGTQYTAGKYVGKYAGTIGDFGAFSFNGNKIITTGGGGMVVAKDSAKAEHMRYLSTQAKDDPLFYVHNEVGYNYRMTNVQAAIGVAQMEELSEFIERKNVNYDRYAVLLSDWKHGALGEFRKGIHSNKWFYSLILKDDIKKDVEEIIHTLSEKQIQTRAIWGLIHEQKPYRECIAYKIERANYYKNHVINIPCSTNLSEEDIEYVVSTIKEVI